MDFIIGCICGSILAAVTILTVILWREKDIYDKSEEE